MDIDRLIHTQIFIPWHGGFGSLMDIDRLIRMNPDVVAGLRFGSLMDIDRLILQLGFMRR